MVELDSLHPNISTAMGKVYTILSNAPDREMHIAKYVHSELYKRVQSTETSTTVCDRVVDLLSACDETKKRIFEHLEGLERASNESAKAMDALSDVSASIVSSSASYRASAENLRVRQAAMTNHAPQYARYDDRLGEVSTIKASFGMTKGLADAQHATWKGFHGRIDRMSSTVEGWMETKQGTRSCDVSQQAFTSFKDGFCFEAQQAVGPFSHDLFC